LGEVVDGERLLSKMVVHFSAPSAASMAPAGVLSKCAGIFQNKRNIACRNLGRGAPIFQKRIESREGARQEGRKRLCSLCYLELAD